MEKSQFLTLCYKYNIDPAIALENRDLIQLLKHKKYDNYAQIEQFLKHNF